MVENRFNSIERDIRDIKAGQERLVQAFSDLAVQTTRLDLIERDVAGHEKWLRKINEQCITRDARIDAMALAPQSWWDRNVASATGRVLWLAIGAAVGVAVARWMP